MRETERRVSRRLCEWDAQQNVIRDRRSLLSTRCIDEIHYISKLNTARVIADAVTAAVVLRQRERAFEKINVTGVRYVAPDIQRRADLLLLKPTRRERKNESDRKNSWRSPSRRFSRPKEHFYEMQSLHESLIASLSREETADDDADKSRDN